jgi:hypothetical protein
MTELIRKVRELRAANGQQVGPEHPGSVQLQVGLMLQGCLFVEGTLAAAEQLIVDGNLAEFLTDQRSHGSHPAVAYVLS